jgi:hypothetical protein
VVATVVFACVSVALSCCREPPNTPAPRIAHDTSCKKDWECTPAPACCVAPCSSDVINTRDMERARADLRCDPAEQCPVAGGCQTYAYLCVDNACKIVFSNEPAFRKREIQP